MYTFGVCPVALRSYLATYVNICWGIGQVIGIAFVKSCWPGRTAGRACAAVECGRAIVTGVWRARGGWCATEVWGIRSALLAMMQHKTKFEEKRARRGVLGLLQQKRELERTEELVCVVGATQTVAGNSFTGYAGGAFAKFHDLQRTVNIASTPNVLSITSAPTALGYWTDEHLWALYRLFLGFICLAPARRWPAPHSRQNLFMLVWALICPGAMGYAPLSDLITSDCRSSNSVVLGGPLHNVVGISRRKESTPACAIGGTFVGSVMYINFRLLDRTEPMKTPRSRRDGWIVVLVGTLLSFAFVPPPASSHHFLLTFLVSFAGSTNIIRRPHEGHRHLSSSTPHGVRARPHSLVHAPAHTASTYSPAPVPNMCYVRCLLTNTTLAHLEDTVRSQEDADNRDGIQWALLQLYALHSHRHQVVSAVGRACCVEAVPFLVGLWRARDGWCAAEACMTCAAHFKEKPTHGTTFWDCSKDRT
ncbi:hypothetical protein GGX14DRAFT_662607 [Mycena pura]|uniref:Uncharacterized protein n=1 Tax=Mycena pura TaxID=153505 RepID=A0AAD6VVB3_9AGAR|nr:hypothetical protein GGX14DRAFT_662607 [Mycena pura]